MNGKTFTYLLHLEGDNYYVGKTTDVLRRLTKHFSGGGSAWTKKHRPVGICGVWPGDIETSVYFIFKAIVGANSIRGAGYTRTV